LTVVIEIKCNQRASEISTCLKSAILTNKLSFIALAIGLLLQSTIGNASTRDEISATLKAVCMGGGDCEAAVKATIEMAKSPQMADMVGTALADAVASIGAENPDLATTMLLAITEAPSDVQMAYQSAVDVATAVVPKVTSVGAAGEAP
jgi:hypothetical protein